MKRTKISRNFLVLFGGGLFFMVLLGSCDAITGFFSSSWGSNLERDQGRLLPKITAKNAAELANDTAGDPKKAKLVAEKILDALKNTTDPAEKAALLNAGLIAANNASNLITVMMSNIDAFSNSNGDVGTVLEKVQAAGDVRANANLISGLLDASGANTDSGLLAGATQDNLALAAVTLLLADAQEQDYTDASGQKEYLDNFATNKTSATLLTDKQNMALDLAQAAAGKKDGVLKDVLDTLNLTS
jgi:PleD family two-component response regulator